MERKLATLKTIENILPIEGADKIELAVVGGWKVVVGKDVGHKVGDMVVYCEVDSFLPIKEEFEFLRKSSYKKMGDLEGFRLKTIKLRGQLSQGLILPLVETFGDFSWTAYEGLDVTERLGIIKYEPPIPAELAGQVIGGFPSFIRKTDEERIQNLSAEYDELKTLEYYVTEKLDGTSSTFYFNNGTFGVCGRNWEYAETETNTYWKVARKLDLEEKMKSLGYNVCFQGELVGEGIQGNPYKLKGQTVYFYNVFNIDTQEYLNLNDFVLTMTSAFYSMLEFVPVIVSYFKLPETIDELLILADGKSVLCNTTDREGLVIRTIDRKHSFKVISNNFLLNEK
jgi:RNA ligase (TIGR02306 family)